MMWSYTRLWLALFIVQVAAANEALQDGIVLKAPSVVAADASFTINVNLTNAPWPNDDCTGPGDCAWSYFRTYLMADPTHDTQTDRSGDGSITIWRSYCYLSGCVGTNVTNFKATIPAKSFPNGYPYSLDYALFNVEPNGSQSLFSPTFSSFSGTIFNLSDATGNWTDFAYQMSNYGIETALLSTPCDKVPCVEECQTKYVAPYVPFPQRMLKDLDACIAACQEGEDPIADCIVKNATVSREKATTTATSATTTMTKTTASATQEQSGKPASTKPSRAASIVVPMLSWALFSSFVASMTLYLN